MSDRRLLHWGGVPVPYSVSWSSEEHFFIGDCPYAKRWAICQADHRGEGKPQFGKPHACRQREVIANGLCDLCAKPLRMSTKVSLSHARPIAHSANGWEILQVEPLLHRACAAISMEHCPSLKRDIANGTLMVRQVTSWRPQFAIMDEVFTSLMTGEAQTAVGHAKVELRQWHDRDADWLAAA